MSDRCPSWLTSGFGITRQEITKHLLAMDAAGLVRSTRQGRESVWLLNERRLEDARRYLELVSKRRDGALGRLRAFVDSA